MIVDPDFPDHWKTRMLVNLLQDEAAPVYLLRLWGHCQNRKQSAFTLTPEALKALCRFPGHANQLESSLVASGFVRRDDRGQLLVVNWEDYNAGLIANWENGRKGGRPKKPTGSDWVNPSADSVNPMETDSREESGVDGKEKNTSPPPRANVREKFRQDWNATKGTVAVDQIAFDQVAMSAGLIADENFQRAYPKALAKFPLKAFGEPMTITQFLREGVMGRILAGDYDRPWSRGSASGGNRSRPQLPKLADHDQ